MSEYRNHDSEENQDQAFIDALYNDLDKTASPSHLDAKILAAAHQAVAGEPLVTHKRPRWIKPLSAAATVLLVAGVSLHQLLDPAAPLDADAYISQSSYAEDAMFSSKRKSETVVLEKQQEQEQKIALRAAKKMAQISELLAPQQQASRLSKAKASPSPALTETASIPQAFADADSEMAAETLMDEEVTNATVLLDQDKFRLLADGKWFFLDQDEKYYYLRYADHNAISYKADKTVFSLLEAGEIEVDDRVRLQLNVVNE